MDSVKKTILLTGATGFLGSALLKRLLKFYEIVIVKRSFSETGRIKDCLDKVAWYDIDKEGLQAVFKKHTIDIIIHTACNYGKPPSGFHDVIESNLHFPILLLNHAIQNKVGYFINCDTVLKRTTNQYTLSKKQFLEWLLFNQHAIHTINLQLETFYGPNDASHKFINMLAQRMLASESSIDLTEGIQERDFIYIDDVVNAFDLILKKIADFESFQEIPIGTGQCHSIREVALLVKKIADSDINLNFGALPYRSDELMVSRADTSQLKSLGWRVENSLEEGIKEVVEFEKGV